MADYYQCYFFMKPVSCFKTQLPSIIRGDRGESLSDETSQTQRQRSLNRESTRRDLDVCERIDSSFKKHGSVSISTQDSFSIPPFIILDASSSSPPPPSRMPVSNQKVSEPLILSSSTSEVKPIILRPKYFYTLYTEVFQAPSFKAAIHAYLCIQNKSLSISDSLKYSKSVIYHTKKRHAFLAFLQKDPMTHAAVIALLKKHQLYINGEKKECREQPIHATVFVSRSQRLSTSIQPSTVSCLNIRKHPRKVLTLIQPSGGFLSTDNPDISFQVPEKTVNNKHPFDTVMTEGSMVSKENMDSILAYHHIGRSLLTLKKKNSQTKEKQLLRRHHLLDPLYDVKQFGGYLTSSIPGENYCEKQRSARRAHLAQCRRYRNNQSEK